MDPKFLVIEIDSKDQAVQLVQVMLDKGFARLMLLDDLAKHPTFSKIETDRKENMKDKSTSTNFKNEQKMQDPETSNSLSSVPKTEPTEVEENEDVEHRGIKRPHEEDDSADYRDQIMNLLLGKPEIVPIGVTSVSEDTQASGSETKQKSKVGEYHQCQLCGVCVKTPRSGRWNLQMHAIALHCVGRQYKCKECDYLDYRKSTLRKHSILQHGSDIPPINIINDEMKKEWHEAMQRCFPEFADRTGFA